MNDLSKRVLLLKKSDISKTVEKRIREFESVDKKDSNALFSELCFCILTANFNAQRAIEIQKKIGTGFWKLSEKDLSLKLKSLGYRYPNTRASYIVLAREHKPKLVAILNQFEDELELRDWIAKNVKGLGYKEASHFLRNIGYKNCAIIDFHIADLLTESELMQKPKSFSKKTYLETENILRALARQTKIDLARLDLYLWFFETGKILK
jgi:N-glycosylase/DNA lyase